MRLLGSTAQAVAARTNSKRKPRDSKMFNSRACELAQEEPPQFPRVGIVVAVRTLARGLGRNSMRLRQSGCGGVTSTSNESDCEGSANRGFIVAWPAGPALRLERTLRRNRLGRLGTLLYPRSASTLQTTRNNPRGPAAHIRTSETAGGAEVPIAGAPLKAGRAAIRWSILRPPSRANIRQSPLLSSVHLCGAPHRPR